MSLFVPTNLLKWIDSQRGEMSRQKWIIQLIASDKHKTDK